MPGTTSSGLPPHGDRRRGVRVAPEGLLNIELAVRTMQGTQPLEVRDISCVGLGLTGARPLPVTLGERVYVLVDYLGHPMIHGALIRARVRRRRPDRDGWFVGIEIDDLRRTPWSHVVHWIDEAAGRQGLRPRVHRPSRTVRREDEPMAL